MPGNALQALVNCRFPVRFGQNGSSSSQSSDVLAGMTEAAAPAAPAPARSASPALARPKTPTPSAAPFPGNMSPLLNSFMLDKGDFEVEFEERPPSPVLSDSDSDEAEFTTLTQLVGAMKGSPSKPMQKNEAGVGRDSRAGCFEDGVGSEEDEDRDEEMEDDGMNEQQEGAIGEDGWDENEEEEDQLEDENEPALPRYAISPKKTSGRVKPEPISPQLHNTRGKAIRVRGAGISRRAAAEAASEDDEEEAGEAEEPMMEGDEDNASSGSRSRRAVTSSPMKSRTVRSLWTRRVPKASSEDPGEREVEVEAGPLPALDLGSVRKRRAETREDGEERGSKRAKAVKNGVDEEFAAAVTGIMQAMSDREKGGKEKKDRKDKKEKKEKTKESKKEKKEGEKPKDKSKEKPKDKGKAREVVPPAWPQTQPAPTASTSASTSTLPVSIPHPPLTQPPRPRARPRTPPRRLSPIEIDTPPAASNPTTNTTAKGKTSAKPRASTSTSTTAPSQKSKTPTVVYKKNAVHWALDGSLLVQLAGERYKIHRSRIVRASGWFAEVLETYAVAGKASRRRERGAPRVWEEEDEGGMVVVSLDGTGVRKGDWEALLEGMDEAVGWVHHPPPLKRVLGILRCAVVLRVGLFEAWGRRVLEEAFPDALDRMGGLGRGSGGGGGRWRWRRL
ncbi:hypothetical protein D9611_010722 [Ephemerocybe angulata]|uniref:BTB domain-containing protein n=1 Tax=Ephemerocybe angulata TaxID=980116 RepID=A0A8H5F1X2_9AGAR|nr:hypothetical protein D9611_010722 [Tulosesus angulatus]